MLITPDDVQNADDPAKEFAEYCRQTLGTPWPTLKDMIILRKKTKEFFEHYPHATWHTLCRVVVFSRSRKRRHAHVWAVMEDFRRAYVAGVLPELDPVNRVDEKFAGLVERALESEDDPSWRRRLLLAQGSQQEEVYSVWRKERWEKVR